MAGAYPDVPGHRRAWDRDNTRLLHHTTGGVLITDYGTSSSLHTGLNGEAFTNKFITSSNGSYSGRITWLFPEQRDIVGYCFVAGLATGTFTLYTSPDTTNGVDGTWTNQGSVSWSGNSLPALREQIRSVSWNGIVGVRLQWSNGTVPGGNDFHFRLAHFYGSPSAGEAPDRLRLWHPTLDQEVDGAYFDWGDVARSTSADREFRVYNPSALTANGVLVSTEALTNTSPSITSQHTFSFGGGAFATSADIGDIPPATASGIVTIRRTINSGASLGLWWLRIVAAAASYT